MDDYEIQDMEDSAFNTSMPEGMEGYHMPQFEFILHNIKLFVIFPIVLITNLLLFIKIVGNKKIRSEPWRWLITQYCICALIEYSIYFDYILSWTYHTPSLQGTPLCAIQQIISRCTFHIMFVSLNILLTERFHAVRYGKENEGGMSKKAGIVILVTFWIVVIGLQGIEAITGKLLGHDIVQYYDNFKHCYFGLHEFQFVTTLILTLWGFVTSIVVFTGMLVMRQRNTSSEDVKQAIIHPIIALSIFAFFYSVISFMLFCLQNMIYHFHMDLFHILYIFIFLFAAAFPVTWLITWDRNGDITLACIKKIDGERKPLLELN